MELNFEKIAQNEYPDYLDLGVHKVQLTGIESNEDNPDKPFLKIGFVNKEGEHQERFYMSEKAIPISNKKILQIANACDVPEEKVKECTTSEDLNNLLVNHELKIKISGEEYENSNGEKKIRKGLLAWKFCCKPDEDTLHFIHNKMGDSGDIKYIKQPEKSSSEKSNDDVPF